MFLWNSIQWVFSLGCWKTLYIYSNPLYTTNCFHLLHIYSLRAISPVIQCIFTPQTLSAVGANAPFRWAHPSFSLHPKDLATALSPVFRRAAVLPLSEPRPVTGASTSDMPLATWTFMTVPPNYNSALTNASTSIRCRFFVRKRKPISTWIPTWKRRVQEMMVRRKINAI